MTVGEFRRWLEKHDVKDSFVLAVATFRNGSASVDDVDAVSLNGRLVQIEILPEATPSIAPEIGASVDNAIDNMKLGLKPDWE